MRRIDSGEILCRKCRREELPEPELLRYLDDYVADLPETMKVPQEEYARRLALCGACPHRLAYTCQLCGCYVQARAAKRNNRCPIPFAPQWEAWKAAEE